MYQYDASYFTMTIVVTKKYYWACYWSYSLSGMFAIKVCCQQKKVGNNNSESTTIK